MNKLITLMKLLVTQRKITS